MQWETTESNSAGTCGATSRSGRGSFVKNSRYRRDRVLFGKGSLAGEHLVKSTPNENTSERASTGFPAACSGRHVSCRSKDGSHLCSPGDGCVKGVCLIHLGQAEIQHLHPACGLDVGRLEIAVDDAALVRILHASAI